LFTPQLTSTTSILDQILFSIDRHIVRSHIAALGSLYRQLFHILKSTMLPHLMHKVRHDTPPKVTFYLTLVFELHADAEQYTYSIEYVTFFTTASSIIVIVILTRRLVDATHLSPKPTTASACSPAATPTPTSAKLCAPAKTKTQAASGAPGRALATMPETFASSPRSGEP
jgi:hypothetical protein